MVAQEDSPWPLWAAAPNALLVIDAAGKILFVNDHIDRLFGWPPDELVSQHIDILVSSQYSGRKLSLYASDAADSASLPIGSAFELPARRRDGSEFAAAISVNVVNDGSDTSIVLIGVRYLGRTERERRHEVVDRQEPSDRPEGFHHLVGHVAHDVNNLLGVILNYTTLLTRRLTDSVALADLGQMRAAAEQAADLTRQLATAASSDREVREVLDG